MIYDNASSNLFMFAMYLAPVSESGVRWGRPTKRAADLGYAPRFQAFILDSSSFRQTGVAWPHPKRLTQTVGRT
jgi:hypothetical protein